MGEIFFYMIPAKYRTIGHILTGLGGFFIIFMMIYIYAYYINIIGQACMIIGLSGIYLCKTKNLRVREFEQNKRIEQKNLNELEEKSLAHRGVYLFYAIIIVGIIFSSYFITVLFSWVFQGDSIFISIMLPYPVILVVGDLLLLGGLVILYYKKRKGYWYKLANLPISYRIAQYWKCKDCENKFRSKIKQCPHCSGENLKQRSY